MNLVLGQNMLATFSCRLDRKQINEFVKTRLHAVCLQLLAVVGDCNSYLASFASGWHPDRFDVDCQSMEHATTRASTSGLFWASITSFRPIKIA